MGIFDRLFGKRKSIETESKKTVSAGSNVRGREDVSISYSVAYKLVGYNSDVPPWCDKNPDKLDEMIKKSDAYFSRERVYDNEEIQLGGLALDFNVWKFAKWEQKDVTTKEVDGVVVEKKVED